MIDHNESPLQKDLHKPFEIRNFCTEWDDWCKYKLSIIDRKFGKLPWLIPLARTHWWRWNQDSINETIEKNPVVRLSFGARDDHIEKLFNACARTGQPRLIISDTKIPQSHPDNVRVIVTEPLGYQFSRTFVDNKIKPVYHRQSKDLEHPFFIMAKGNDFGRPKLMLMLQQLGLLDKAIYSVGDIDAKSHKFFPDKESINIALEDMTARTLGGEYIKFDVSKNLKLLPHLINRCHFYTSIDTNGLYKERLLFHVNEKTLWGYCTTVPTLPIWYDSVAEQMQEWGYRFKNIPYRLPEETTQETVVRWCKEILFHSQITQNDLWSQSWQDARGEDAIHNYELTVNLHRIISENVEQQISELPQEFKKK